MFRLTLVLEPQPCCGVDHRIYFAVPFQSLNIAKESSNFLSFNVAFILCHPKISVHDQKSEFNYIKIYILL